jgi:hypothetical protein
VYFFQGYE